MKKKTFMKRVLDKVLGGRVCRNQYIKEKLAAHEYAIQQLQDTKQYFADLAANHAYRLTQLEQMSKNENDSIYQLGLKVKYLLEGDENKAPKVVQLVQDLRYGDAVGNYILGITDVLNKNGILCKVFAENVDSRIQRSEIGMIDNLPVLNKKDILILHVAAENRMMEMLDSFFCKIIICYHNITPSSFFEDYDKQIAESSRRGRQQLQRAIKYADYCIADSDYNKEDLINMGFNGEIQVIPPLLHNNKSSIDLKKRNENDCILLSVGRIVPNKKIEDILCAYKYYKEKYNKQAKLVLAGSYDNSDLYYQELEEYINSHGINDVVFTGHVSTEKLNACFASANVYLCMSEHEGFCVPLIEAMQFQIPVVAFDSTAIPYTLGKAGVVLHDKNFEVVAKVIDRLFSDLDYREGILKGQAERLKDFEADKLEKEILEFIIKVLEE